MKKVVNSVALKVAEQEPCFAADMELLSSPVGCASVAPRRRTGIALTNAHLKGVTMAELSAKYGVSRARISQVIIHTTEIWLEENGMMRSYHPGCSGGCERSMVVDERRNDADPR